MNRRDFDPANVNLNVIAIARRASREVAVAGRSGFLLEWRTRRLRFHRARLCRHQRVKFGLGEYTCRRLFNIFYGHGRARRLNKLFLP